MTDFKFKGRLVADNLKAVGGGGTFGATNLGDFLTGNESPEEFTDIVQEVFDKAASESFKVIVPVGRFGLTRKITLNGNVHVVGQGPQWTEFYAVSSGYQLFGNSKADSFDFFVMEDIRLTGRWSEEPGMGVDEDRLMAIWKYKYVRLYNVWGTDSKQMGITAGLCDYVDCDTCRLERIARDGFNFTSSKSGRVTNCVLKWIGDDSIAIHQQPIDGPSYQPHGWNITDNIIEDGFGIKVLGIKKAVIADNVLKRPKGYGIYITFDSTPGFEEGYVDVSDVVISGNNITDIINANAVGGGNLQRGIYVDSMWNPSIGLTEANIVAANNSYNDYWISSVGALTSKSGGHRLTISFNIIAQSLPDVPSYNSWGLGLLFHPNGFINPAITLERTMSGIGIGNLTNLIVSNNIIYSAQYGLQVTKTMPGGHIDIKDNHFIRVANFCINVDNFANQTASTQWVVDGNLFDMDPFFEDTNRTPGKVGTWINSNFMPSALQIANTKGWVIRNNTFRNMAKPLHHGGTGSYTLADNFYRMEMSVGGIEDNNKGIRLPLGVESGYLIQEDCTGTSPTLGQIIYQQSGFRRAAIPTEGWFVKGQFIWLINPDVIGDRVFLGWKRLTTGNGHVLDTDWARVYAFNTPT